MAQPVESSERRAESTMADQAGSQKPADLGDELGGRLRHRYLGSPGVLQLENTLGLARRVSRWSSGRLPLLATIQRRWSLAERPLAGSASALLCARPPVGGGSRPPSADSAQSMPDGPKRSVGPPDLIPLPGGRVGLQRAAAAQPATGPPPQRSMASQGRGALEVQAASTVSRLGAAILRRHLSGPAARTVQRREAEIRQAHASSHPTAGLAEDAQAAVIQREGVVQHTPRTAQAEGSAGAAGNLGTAVLQRQLAGPGAWVMRRQAAPPGRAPLRTWTSPQSFAAGTADAATPQISGRTVRRATQSLPTTDRPVSLQREIDDGFPPALANVTPPATGEGHPAIENTAASGSPAGLTPLRRVWSPSPKATVPIGETYVMRQLAPLVSRPPRSGVETMGVPLGPRGDSYIAAPDMPLLRMAERGAKTAEDRVAAPDSRTSAGSGTTVDLLLQGAVTETSVAPPPTDVSGTASSSPVGKPSAPSEATSGTGSMESIDLERLADQVYAIIERRLTIERESLGL